MKLTVVLPERLAGGTPVLRYRLSRGPLIVAGGLIAALAATGCVQPRPVGRIGVWAVSGSQRVTAEDAIHHESDCYRHLEKRITLRAARNEVVACQLVLRTETAALDRVVISIGQLAGERSRLAPTTVRAYRPLFVKPGSTPSWLLTRPDVQRSEKGVPDILVPLDAPAGGQPFSLPAGATLPIWIDATIEPNAEPGTYDAEIDVTGDGAALDQVHLQVQVLPFSLPAEPGMPVLVGVDMPTLFRHHLERDGKPCVPAGVVNGDPTAEDAAVVIDQTFQILHAHRCSPYLTGFYPAVSLDTAGWMKVMWETYDRTVASYLAGSAFADRVRQPAWPMPFDQSFPPPASYGGAMSPAYASAVQDYLRQCAAHFAEKGWLDRHFLFARCPQSGQPEPAESLKALGSLLGQADPKLRLLTTTIPQSMIPFGWQNHRFDPTVSSGVSIWAPLAQFYDAATMDQQRALGRTVWMTVGRPPFSPSLMVGAPQVDPAALPWQAFRYGIDGLILPPAGDWPTDLGGATVSGEGQWLIYPGKPFGVQGPIATVRLKQLRRGLHDLEYLRLLKRHNQGALAETIARMLFRYGGSAAYEDHFADGCQWPWAEEPELWDLARHVMADRLAQVLGGSSPSSFEQFVQTVDWRRLVDAACKIRVYCEGARIRSASQPPSASETEIELHVVVRNERPEPLSGRLRFDRLPLGWKAVSDNQAVDALPSLGKARLILTARAGSVATNEVGVAYVPLVFDGGASGRVEIAARLTEITARQLDHPVEIDGDLSDWPPGIRNVAGDFIQVAGQDPALAGREPTGRARQQTLVFVGYDLQRVYFAFNCREEQVDRLPGTGNNFVQYDGLLPTGEDLLEILIDPSNAGTGRPIDIYRVVVRPTGATLAKKGVTTGTGWGAGRAWPADVRVATARQERGWTAEVSVPLSAFDQAARANKRWAVNFTRYQPRLGEYSSWSGARRYFYNTRSFGNLQWP